MTFEQLMALHAIVAEGTFRGAAERLHKSQSAISTAVKKLEHELDLLLLSRDDYRPRLTADGEVFYRQATRVMQQMQDLKALAKNLKADQESEVTLVATATLPIAPLLPLIQATRESYPATHVRLATESMGGPIERLLASDADMVLASLDGVPLEDVEAVPFCTLTILPVAHPDYLPGEEMDMLSQVTMQAYTQIVVAGSGSGAFSQSRDLLPGANRWTVSDFATKKDILLGKMGWGGLPAHLIQQELAAGQLVPLNIQGRPIRHSQIFLIRQRQSSPGKVAQALWQTLTDNSADIDGDIP